MRIKRIILAAVLCLCFVVSSALAQNAPPRLEIFAEGGASILNHGTGQISEIVPCTPCTGPVCPAVVASCPTTASVTGSFSKTGRLFTGGRIRFTRHDALEASYSFSPNRLSFLQGNQSFGFGYNRVDLVSFNYVHYLWVRTSLQPFATVGVGTNHFSGGPSAVPATVSSSINSDNGYKFAWNYGGGADVVLQRHFGLRLELRDYVTGQPGLLTGTSHNIVPSAGVVFRFK